MLEFNQSAPAVNTREPHAPLTSCHNDDTVDLMQKGQTSQPIQNDSHIHDRNINTRTTSMKWTLILVLSHLLLDTCLPFYNKLLFQIYNYPITSVLIQVIGVVIFLSIYSIIVRKRDTSYNYNYNYNVTSCKFIIHDIFWCNLKIKFYYLIMPSLLFSLSILLTNIGIDIASVDINALLNCSKIIWFVILTPIITRKDFPTLYAIILSFVLMIGTTLFSWSMMDSNKLSVAQLIVNALSSFFSPLQVVCLKRATNVLADPTSEERIRSGVKQIVCVYEIY